MIKDNQSKTEAIEYRFENIFSPLYEEQTWCALQHSENWTNTYDNSSTPTEFEDWYATVYTYGDEEYEYE